MTANLEWLLTRTEPWEILHMIDGEYCCKVGTWLRGPEPVAAYAKTLEDAIGAVRAKYDRRAA